MKKILLRLLTNSKVLKICRIITFCYDADIRDTKYEKYNITFKVILYFISICTGINFGKTDAFERLANKEFVANIWLNNFNIVMMYRYMSPVTKLILWVLIIFFLLHFACKKVKKYNKKIRRLQEITDGNLDNEIYVYKRKLFSRLHSFNIGKEVFNLLLTYVVVYAVVFIYTICVY